jgi:tRNA (guanine37-N1)-methyltransferase
MHIAVVTLFPEMLEAVSGYGVSGRAVEQGLLRLTAVNPRNFTRDRHRTVDDRPYGGGPGMLMKVEPLEAAFKAARDQLGERPHAVYLSPQGRRLEHATVQRLAHQPRLLLLAGRYEGVDERFLAREIDEEVSIGDYVLSGGELAAMVLVDAVTRLLPGALGHSESAQQDSFADGLLDCPHYTRPEVYAGARVPEVLLSGDHERIRRWRLQQSLGRTLERRPDLLARRVLNEEEQELLAACRRERKALKELKDRKDRTDTDH